MEDQEPFEFELWLQSRGYDRMAIFDELPALREKFEEEKRAKAITTPLPLKLKLKYRTAGK